MAAIPLRSTTADEFGRSDDCLSRGDGLTAASAAISSDDPVIARAVDLVVKGRQ